MDADAQASSSYQLSGTGSLRPKARLLRTLGSDLISSDKVALIELVKNSYDADASIVVVRFHGPLEKGEGRIEIWDNGHGMTSSMLQESWLNIATNFKEKHPRSARGRRVLGEKGIGRLAAARLGQEMMLSTRMEESQEVKLLIDWADFDRDDAYLDEIEVAWDVGSPDIFSKNGSATELFSVLGNGNLCGMNGTVIQIDKLSRAWGEREILDLRTALTRLIRPRPSSDVVSSNVENVGNDFQIFIDFVDVDDRLNSLGGLIEPASELRTPHYSLSGSVDARGLATLRYKQLFPPLNDAKDDVNLWVGEEGLPQAGPFDFEISVWDRDNAAIRQVIREVRPEDTAPSARDLKGFRDILSEVAGVSIYRDGFRVLPFGEHGDDWLGLDLRRVQSPTRRVSNNQVIGHVFIGADSNAGLKDQSNREGILAGDAYSDLQNLVRAALSNLEIRRYEARHPKTDSPERNKGGLFKQFDLSEVRSIVKDNHPDDKRLIALVEQKNRDIKEGVKKTQEVLSRYSRLATLGTLIDRIVHDGKTVLMRIKGATHFGVRDLRNMNLAQEKKIQVALDSMSGVSDQAEFLSLLFDRIAPFGGRKRGRPKEISISDVVDKAIAILQQEADDRSVELVSISEDINVKIDEGELLTVLVNLIQNALYWSSTQRSGVDCKVIVTASFNEDSSLCVVVSDSGPGVEESVRDYIFDPYFSTKPDGIGLGLSIAGDIVEDIYDGRLALVDQGLLDGATFEAVFKRRVQ